MTIQSTIRIGIIGCGAIAAEHAKALSQVEGAKIVACCDVVTARAEEYCNTYRLEYATPDPQRILDDPGIDVVYVLTQHDSHADLCIRAAQASKHVLAEK